MFLDYFALGVLVFMVVTLFYSIRPSTTFPISLLNLRTIRDQGAIHVAGVTECQLRGGFVADGAVGEHWHPVAVLRTVRLRICRMNWVFLEH